MIFPGFSFSAIRYGALVAMHDDGGDDDVDVDVNDEDDDDHHHHRLWWSIFKG